MLAASRKLPWKQPPTIIYRKLFFMKVASTKQQRENLPLGRHNAQVVSAEGNSIEFELVDCDQRGTRLSWKLPKLIQPKSSYGKAIGLLQGYGPLPDEELDLARLVGKRCSIFVGLDDGEKVIIGVGEEQFGSKY